MALYDDHTSRATSLAAFCHNLANFFQNSNSEIAGAEDPSAQAPAMSKFDFFFLNWPRYGKVRFPQNLAAKHPSK